MLTYCFAAFLLFIVPALFSDHRGRLSKTPDDALFHYLANIYASKHGTMYKGNLCAGDNFRNGVTNGAEWYDVKGEIGGFLSLPVNKEK